MSNIKIFVGCAANNEDLESQAVLHWSIIKHASRPVDIVWMQQSNDEKNFFYCGPGGWNTKLWATPFSGFRWGIAAHCGYNGRAIYCDSDMIFYSDPAKLFDQVIPRGYSILGKGGGQWRICCSLIDCAEIKNHIPDIDQIKKDPRSHSKLCNTVARTKTASFSGNWNCLDRELAGRKLPDPSINVLHYTDMRSQPQLRHAIKRLGYDNKSHWFDGKLQLNKYPAINREFDRLLNEAIENGYHPDNYKIKEFGTYIKRSNK